MPRNHKALERAKALHQDGRVDEAITIYRGLLRDEPDNAFVLDFLAQALQLLRRQEEALYARRQAVRAEPGNLFLRDRLAALLLEMGEPEASVEVWRDLVRISNSNPSAELGLAGQLARAKMVPEATALMDELVRRRPGDRAVALECAVVHERMGNAASAQSLVAGILSLDPDDVDANTLMARLESSGGSPDAARARLERIVAMPRGAAAGRTHALFAQVLDKLGDFDRAFTHAEIAQRLQYEAMPLQEKNLEIHEVISTLAQKLTAEEIAAWPRPSSGWRLPAGVPAPPVFVVGFPRSGTTLIEQMLSAHPNLAVSDELPNLQAIRQKLYAEVRRGGHFPSDLKDFTPRQVEMGRQWYLERAYKTVPEAGGKLDGGTRKRLVDKQPLNTVEMCFARLIFPDSPVIYVQRDPRDTLVSIFMQGFTHAVPHLFTTEGIARLMTLFAGTWDHYERVLGMRTMRVRYEDLVDDPEREARRMIEFIGEPWDPAVLNYHAPEHRRFVTTPSYSDVAKPVYKRALGRWKKYERHLAPVLGALAPLIRAGGYAEP